MNIDLKELNAEIMSLVRDIEAIYTLPVWQDEARSDRLTTNELIDAVRVSGLLSKFEEPSDDRRSELELAQMQKFLAANAALKDPFGICYSEEDWTIINRAREHMKAFSKAVRYDLNDLFYGPGSNLSVKRGRIGYADKVRQVITVYPHQVGLAIAVLSKIRVFRRYYRSKYCILPGATRDEQETLLLECIRSNLVVVGGARATTVYKNREKRRLIAVESSFGTMFQRVIGRAFRRAIKDVFGIDLDNQADVHKKDIMRKSSVDEEDASNSVHRNDPRFLGLGSLHCELMRLAAPEATWVQLDDKAGYVNNNLCSTMGCGFTFELLTLMNLCYSRAFDDSSGVFGDDVLIDDSKLDEFVDFIQRATNFTINRKKTFSLTRDRATESCGAVQVDGEIVENYSIKWIESPETIIPTVNKIYWLARTLNNGEVRELIKRAHRKLIRMLKDSGFVPGPYTGSDLPEYLIADEDACAPQLRCHKRLLERLHYEPNQAFIATTLKVEKESRKYDFCKSYDQRLLFVFLKTNALPVSFKRTGKTVQRPYKSVFLLVDGRPLTD